MTTPGGDGYGAAAKIYQQQGWRPFPLPRGQKHPPPNGTTGAEAYDPSDADILDWTQTFPDGNVGIRMPDNVIGLDVDTYDDKQGAATLHALSAKLGPLPKTYRSTARDNGAGIGFFRVEAGIRWKGQAGPDIEIIQRRHRYAVVPPSIHPTGTQYRWYAPGETAPMDGAPAVDDLPFLPSAWVEALRYGTANALPAPNGTTERAGWHVDVQAIYWAGRDQCDGTEGSRHDAVSKTVMRLLNEIHRDKTGAAAALADLGKHYVDAIGSRSGRDEATAEWNRMVAGGWEKVQDRPPPNDMELDALIPKTEHASSRVTTDFLDLRQFVQQDVPEYDWIVPELVERQDRIILTGEEGGGKTTFLRQFGVMAAAGIHPFTLQQMEPIRVVHLDLENGNRLSQRKFAELYQLVDATLSDGQHYPVIRPQGLDLQDQVDRRWLVDLIGDLRPDLLVGGPIYKMFGGDPTEELPTKEALLFLDALRAAYKVAVILEAHTPNEQQGKKRTIRPYGASIQRRWPEFGVYLSPEGLLMHWRGARDEREWPSKLRKGRTWPWEVESWGNREAKFADIIKACREAGKILTQREIAAATGISQATVQRAIAANHVEWTALQVELGETGDSHDSW